MKSNTALLTIVLPSLAHAFLANLPPAFNDAPAKWAYVSYTDPSVAVLSGSFNRTAMSAPHLGETSDPKLKKA